MSDQNLDEALGVKKKSEAKETMINPFPDEMPETLGRIRRNLLIFGFICVSYKASGAKLGSSGSLFGLNYESLEPTALELGLLILVIYHLIHFVWTGWEELSKWRLRLTGLQDIKREWEPEDSYPIWDNQYTLYSWWSIEAKLMKQKYSWFQEVQQTFEECKNELENLILNPQPKNFDYVATKLGTLEGAMGHQFESKAPQEIDRNYIDKRLKRFDNWFWSCQWSYIARWIGLEFLLPILLALTGTFWMLPEQIVKLYQLLL